MQASSVRAPRRDVLVGSDAAQEHHARFRRPRTPEPRDARHGSRFAVQGSASPTWARGRVEPPDARDRPASRGRVLRHLRGHRVARREAGHPESRSEATRGETTPKHALRLTPRSSRGRSHGDCGRWRGVVSVGQGVDGHGRGVSGGRGGPENQGARGERGSQHSDHRRPAKRPAHCARLSFWCELAGARRGVDARGRRATCR